MNVSAVVVGLVARLSWFSLNVCDVVFFLRKALLEGFSYCVYLSSNVGDEPQSQAQIKPSVGS